MELESVFVMSFHYGQELQLDTTLDYMGTMYKVQVQQICIEVYPLGVMFSILLSRLIQKRMYQSLMMLYVKVPWGMRGPDGFMQSLFVAYQQILLCDNAPKEHLVGIDL
nr:hypothetical protein Iba_chr14bCG11070 [Ipomoea batatas]